jgi:hypothetical protein
MQPPPLYETDLINIWERGLGLPPARLALALLAAEPDVDPAAAAKWTVGERDSRLLELRERALGPRMALVATCPACEERVEAALEVGDLRVEGGGSVEEELHLEVAGRRLVARLPTAGDLVAIEQAEDVESARLDLLERCILDSEEDPPDERVGAAAAARMAEADPQADIRLALSCPACGADWEEQFDPVSFFWQELDAWALHLVRDVHELASAYGWSEADVLALPPARRRLYLELAAG